MTESIASQGSTRRTVVRAGATAAWVVPAIQLVGVAPAFAASGPAALSVTLAPPVRTPGTTAPTALRSLNLVSSIDNANSSATVGLTVVVHLVPTGAAGFDFYNTTATGAPPMGFAAPVKSFVIGNDKSVTFAYTATSQLSGNGTTAFNPSFDLLTPQSGTVTVTAVPGGAGTSGTDGGSFV